jgi:hypothetical protein
MSAETEERYSLVRFPGDDRLVDISADRFREIMAANDYALLVLGLEEKLDLLIANYGEYEAELLRLALDRSLHVREEWSTNRADMQTINRRVVNVLSAARLYLDQVMHEVCAEYGHDSSQQQTLQSKISGEYDTVADYRLMETLRNHVQHRSLPLAGFMAPTDYEEISRDEDRWRVTIVPYLDIESLEASPKAKTSVVREFARAAVPPDMTRCLRSYLECLCRIHETVRDICAADYERATVMLLQARIEAMGEALSQSLSGTTSVAAVARDARGRPQRVLHLNDIVMEQVRLLRARNRSFDGLARRYVASGR